MGRCHQLLRARLPAGFADTICKGHRQRECAASGLRHAVAIHQPAIPIGRHVSTEYRHRTPPILVSLSGFILVSPGSFWFHSFFTFGLLAPVNRN